jgi:hypothetical protein
MEGKRPKIYDGDGDRLMQQESRQDAERIILTPDSRPNKTPGNTPRIRLMWGQHLLEDLLDGRYHSLVCAVNPVDNSRGIISQLATLLPTSQWDKDSITAYAKQFGSSSADRVKVLKYDMDTVEVLAVSRPSTRDHLTMEDLTQAFRIIAEMIERKSSRYPSASVSFLDAAANMLRDKNGNQPSFETVLRTMYDAGYHGDVYPSLTMWNAGTIGLYPRYPFPSALEQMRGGGF